jgi:hypothetical protein
VDPPSRHFLGDRLFDQRSADRHGDNILAPYIHVRDALQERGIPVCPADFLPARFGQARSVYVSFGMRRDYRRLARREDVILSAFFAMECPIVEPALYRALPGIASQVRRVFTFADAAKLERFTGRRVRSVRYIWPQCANDVRPEFWRRRERAFLTMINANKLPRLYDHELYTERLRAAAFFHQRGEIDLYGRGWDRAPMWLGRQRVPYTFRRSYGRFWEARQRRRPDPVYAAVQAAWRGPVESKAEVLSGYRFAICFENMALQGWITEKMFDCFYAGCVPVYWGAPDVTDWIPREAFVDMRTFRDYEDLRRFLHELGPDDLQRYRDAARDFLRSPQFEAFKPRAFAEQVARLVAEDVER